jgi:hypothetical protein
MDPLDAEHVALMVEAFTVMGGGVATVTIELIVHPLASVAVMV